MDTLEAILQKIGGSYNRAFTNPNPQMSDEDIIKLYKGRTNQYATPDALRDVELGVQQYLKSGPLTLMLDDIRDRALTTRGLKYNQNMYDIPRTSPTGAIMEKLTGIPMDFIVVPKKSNMSDIF